MVNDSHLARPNAHVLPTSPRLPLRPTPHVPSHWSSGLQKRPGQYLRPTGIPGQSSTEIPIHPGQEVFYSASIFATNDAKADISVDFSLRGNLDNAPLPGDYLAAVANAMSATEITRTGPDSITYTVKGTVSANVATSSETEVARVAASTPVGSLAQ